MGHPRLLLLVFQLISSRLLCKVCLCPTALPCVPQIQVQWPYSCGCSDMRHKVWMSRCLSLCSQPIPLPFLTFTGRFGTSDALQYMRYPLETTFELGIKPIIAVNARDIGIQRQFPLLQSAVCPWRHVIVTTSPHGRPLCYSHNVNVKCLILRRFCILKFFQGYCRLSNHLQIWKHTRIPSFLAPFYRKKWPNARKTRAVK